MINIYKKVFDFLENSSINQLGYLISFIIIFLGVIFFNQRSIDGLSPLTRINIDEINYILATKGDVVSFTLHKCRILLPFISKLIPFKAAESIFLLNLLSFFFIIFNLLKFLDFFKIPRKIIVYSLITICLNFSVAYNFTNFYLTDLPSIATLLFFFNSLIKKNFFLSLIWFLISILIRETAIIFAPLFLLVFSKRQLFVSIILIVIAFFSPKLLINGNLFCTSEGMIGRLINRLPHSIDFLFLSKTFVSYGIYWFPALVGVSSFKNFNLNLSKISLYIFICSIIGSTFSSLISITDITRMNLILLPILCLGFACFINQISYKKNINLYLTLFFLCSLIIITGLLPNILISKELNSIDEFIKSNLIIVLIGFFIQFFLAVILIIKYFFEFKTNFKKYK